ncbi:isocitrate lyase/phosphoenolpyruvate mutase family protein [Streptomyces sp. NPDC001073]
MSGKVELFRSLHRRRQPGDPLVLPGPWDAASARALVVAGFPALATPSAGVAASLGYEDGALKDPRRHAEWLAEVRAVAADRLFVNARVDVFLHGDGDPERAIERAALYVAAGADCVYPIMAPAKVLPLLRSGIQGPVNVLARLDGEGPSPTALGELGATRITFGPGLQRWTALALEERAVELKG